MRPAIGIDVGLKVFLADSNGKTVENPRYYRASQATLRRKQRRLCARTKGSHRRHKIAREVAKTHLKSAFQGFANANAGTRASGTPGYDASAQYVYDKLAAAGYNVSFQPFTFAFFRELAPAVLEQVSPTPTSYATGAFTYSGSGNVTALVQAIDVQIPPGPLPTSSTSGCEAADFAGFTPGNIALIQRGICNFSVKAANAQAAGASAVIIFNEGQEGRTTIIIGTLGSPVFSIPVVGASFATGQELYNLLQSGPVTAHVQTNTISEFRTTKNVIAETPKGRADDVIVVGAHLDSRIEGPGINDNGSGSGTILEIALQMSKLSIQPVNKVRFAFWGAEELNLLGSTHYVSNLSAAEIANIAMNLNFDMVGSPNFVRFVYDGDNSAFPVGPGAAAGPPGSAQIEREFADYFSSQGLASAPTPFSGRSDYGPFIAVNIPAGGLFTGAEGVKTAEEAAIFGGTAGVAYDPCYHQACDTFAGTGSGAGATPPGRGLVALDQMSDAAAHVTLAFAMTRDPFKDRAKGQNKKANTDFRGPEPIR